MSYFHWNWAVVWLVISSGLSPARQQANPDRNVNASFSLTISAVTSSVKAGNAIFVEVVLENKTDNVLHVAKALSDDMDQGGWVYKVNVQDVQGKVPPRTEFARNCCPYGSLSGTKLQSGKTLRDRVNVSKLYDLSHRGSYTIQFRRLDPESKTFVVSNKITVKVD